MKHVVRLSPHRSAHDHFSTGVRFTSAVRFSAAVRFTAALCLVALSSACGRQASKAGEQASPSAVDVASADAPAEVPAGEKSRQAREEDATPKQEGAAVGRVDEYDEETEEAPPPPEIEEASRDELSQMLTQAKRQLQAVLEPAELSCEGAAPRRDLICSIADRLCEESTDLSSSQQRQCEEAQQACEQAKQSYSDRCS